MSRNILVPDAPAESDTTVSDDDAPVEEQEAQTSEVTETAEAEPETTIPSKYQDKSLEDVIAMHMNAEKEIGRQANEVGTYRDLLKSMSEAQTVTADAQTDTTKDKPVEVSTDDLWDNPTEAIKSVVQDVVRETIAPISQQQQADALAAQVGGLLKEHPDAEKIGADPEFGDWIAKSEFRLQDAQRWLESQDVDAARRLLGDYKEMKGIQPEEPVPVVDSNEEAVRKARAVTTESGRGSGGSKGKETLSKREVMKVFINDRDLYDSPSFQRKLLDHARRGTLVD